MLRLEKINYKTGNFSLNNIDFSVSKGDYFILIGESGSGKSMLLEIVTGFLTPKRGKIFLHETEIQNFPIRKRNLGIVFQKPTLFPHMTVFENIAFPLKIRKLNRNEINTKINQLAEDTEIAHLLQRDIAHLSGGEAQRVTIARALATDPDVLMLDEPLSFLDIQLKRGISSLLRKINQRGQTIIHVTHDYEEALALANKIAIIENGTIIQYGSPQEVFHKPKSPFVANFIGIKNFFKGQLFIPEYNTKFKIFETHGTKIFIISDEEVSTEGYIIIPSDSITILEYKPNSVTDNSFEGLIKDIYQTKTGVEIVINFGIEISVQTSYHSIEKMNLVIGKKVWISFEVELVSFIKK